MVGRERERDVLARCLESKRPEFLAVYGRRRVGKTYLIKEYFKNRFSFYATGLSGEKTAGQLKAFNGSLLEYGSTETKAPSDWFEGFSRLKKLLDSSDVRRDNVSGKRVVFLDELPWMDTARSDFKSALDHFWNTWGSAQPDLLLIVCGSATSWIIEEILNSTGGFYNRVTRQMHLSPFSLHECEELFAVNGIAYTRKQQLDSYMVFGGIPYYLNLLDERLSLSQNIDALIFQEDGALHNEYNNLFHSLFRNADKHIAVIQALSEKRKGLNRVELIKHAGIADGALLTKALNELIQCGFIRKYRSSLTGKNGCIYQIIDPFTLFSQRYTVGESLKSWSGYIGSPGYHSWSGNAFEIVCLNHIEQIKGALGISGVESSEYTWRSKTKSGGAQIDLLIDRKDDMINVCEMKYTSDEFEIDAAYEKKLINKVETFRKEEKTRKALSLTLVSANGLKRNAHANTVQRLITGDDLFG